ncbi:MAG: hypothetical protein JWR63_3339 [Conexibacter sp.]|nr:hypothetical protein [Conexibacter sp.]
MTIANALIVTALQLERRAVQKHLKNLTIESASGVAADVGTFASPRGEISVAVLETGAGNVGASTLTVRAEEALRPEVVVMVGVAGGLKDVRIGDVVASSKVYWYEGGKQTERLAPRPDLAPVSPTLLQMARGVASADAWLNRIKPPEPEKPSGTRPHAVVAPIVAGEKVLANSTSDVVHDLRSFYGDAVTVDMEDFGTLHGATSAERTKAIAVRGVSDLLDAKAAADASGSQPVAASHAAAFAFELLAIYFRPSVPNARAPDMRPLAEVGARLYPEGPNQHGLWERAGGDPSQLSPTGTGFARWWQAARLLELGGGGAIRITELLDAMLVEFPASPELLVLRGDV